MYLRCAFSFVRKSVIVGRQDVQGVPLAVNGLYVGILSIPYSPLWKNQPIDIQRF
jgi:hypothetical protein